MLGRRTVNMATVFCKIKTFKTSKRPSSCLRIIPETGGHNKPNESENI